MGQPHFIVFANEKGGTGKSTTAVHAAVALAASGHRVGALDLDQRQRTMTRYLDNRTATIKRLDVALPQPAYEVLEQQDDSGLAAALDRLSADADVIVIDTPGRDDPIARAAILRADTLVTPMNDSFVDLDLIGQVDPDTFKITKPSFYAELIWNSRTRAPATPGARVDWGCSATASSRLTRTTSAASARRSTSLPDGSASASSTASASGSFTANCSPRG